MRTVLLASLRVHARRYVAAVVAVVVGVTFVVTTDALASAARDGMVSGLDVPFRQADTVVTDLDGEQAASLVDRARERGDAASVLGWTVQPVSGPGIPSDRVQIGAVADDPRLVWQTVEQGRLPRAAGEAVADVNAAASSGVGVGDRLRVGAGSRATEVTVVGLVDSPSASVGSPLYLTWDDVAPFASSLYVDSVAYAGDPGAVGTATGPDDFVQQRAAELSQGVDVLAIVLLLFAAIALFVSVLVIANTFSILFAQRTRELALLRCVGATRRQLVRSLRSEALAVGVLAAALGVLLGVGAGHGVVAVVRAVSPSARLGEVSHSPWWLAGGFVLGVAVTLVASWLPTRRVLRMSPLSALRPDTGVAVATAAGRRRVTAGAVLVAAGVALLAAAVSWSSTPVMIAGGAASYAGLLVLGPLLMPALVRLGGRGVGRAVGPSGRLALGNTVRHPRRTAATTSSLLVGVTLTAAVLTGLASSRGAVDAEMAVQHPVDLTLTGRQDPTLVDDVRSVEGVRDAVAVPGGPARVSGGVGELTVLAVPGDASRVTHADLAEPGPGEVLLPYELAPDTDRVRVTTETGSATLRVETGEGWGSAALVAPATLERLVPDGTGAVWVRAADGADAENLAGTVAALGTAAGAELGNGLTDRAYVDLQIDVLTGAVVGLLGIAVLIALIGIGNTLGLSVVERAREHALLRALGLTRRQLRRMLAVEALALSLVAAVLGTAVGVAYAWVGVAAMVRAVVPDAPLVVPVGQLALVLLAAAAAGLLACLLPARRAGRVSPVAGLTLE